MRSVVWMRNGVLFLQLQSISDDGRARKKPPGLLGGSKKQTAWASARRSENQKPGPKGRMLLSAIPPTKDRGLLPLRLRRDHPSYRSTFISINNNPKSGLEKQRSQYQGDGGKQFDEHV